jgi:hypothetical protein
LVEAEVTLVAAEATVRGVTAVVRPADVPPAAVRLVAVRGAVVESLAPAVFAALVVFAAPAGFAVPEVFAGSAFLVVRARELARAELAVRTGVAVSAAFFVGGTDLPPIWIS